MGHFISAVMNLRRDQIVGAVRPPGGEIYLTNPLFT